MLLSFERPAASRPFCATPCCGPARIGISKDSASCRTLRRLEVRALCRTLKTAQLANESGNKDLKDSASVLDPSRTRRIRHRAESFPRSQAHWVITEPRATASPLEVALDRWALDHRQDSKGTRWMPRHQESMKGVDDCEKPR